MISRPGDASFVRAGSSGDEIVASVPRSPARAGPDPPASTIQRSTLASCSMPLRPHLWNTAERGRPRRHHAQPSALLCGSHRHGVAAGSSPSRVLRGLNAGSSAVVCGSGSAVRRGARTAWLARALSKVNVPHATKRAAPRELLAAVTQAPSCRHGSIDDALS